MRKPERLLCRNRTSYSFSSRDRYHAVKTRLAFFPTTVRMISIKEVFNKIGARWKHHNNNIYGGHSSHVVICCALRTPITRAKKGGTLLMKSFQPRSSTVYRLFCCSGLAPAYPDDLLLPLFEAVVARTQIDPKEIQDVCVGNCLQPGSGATSSRIAQLLSCVPYSTALYTVNRQCSSGLQVRALLHPPCFNHPSLLGHCKRCCSNSCWIY